jgi:hypothetical protein
MVQDVLAEDFMVVSVAERIPSFPSGTERVTVDQGMKSVVGVNTKVEGSERVQDPGTDGDRMGSGVLRASGSEKRTTTEVVASTPVAPVAGVVESTRIGKWDWAASADLDSSPRRAKISPPVATTAARTTQLAVHTHRL